MEKQEFRITGKTLLKSSAVLLISNIGLKAMNFFLLPLYTGVLSPADYGVADVIGNMGTILYYIGSLGLDWGFSAFFYDEKTESHYGRIFNTSAIMLLVSAAAILLLWFAAPLASTLMFGSQSYVLAIRITLVSTAMHLLYFAPGLNLRIRSKMMQYSIASALGLAISIASNVVCVLILRLGYISILISSAASAFVMLVVFVCCNIRYYKPRNYNPVMAKRLLKYSLPITPTLLLQWVLLYSGRYIIRYFFDDTEVGLYSIASRLTIAITLFSGAINTAYSSFAYSNKDRADAKGKFSLFLSATTAAFMAIAAFVGLFAPEFIGVLTSQDSYTRAYSAVGFLLFAAVAHYVGNITSFGITFQKKGYHLTWICAVTTALNVIVCFLLVPRLGFPGAALASVAAYCAQSALTAYWANRLYPCAFELGKIWTCFALLFVFTRVFMDFTIPIKLCIYGLCLGILLLAFRKTLLPAVRMLQAMRTPMKREAGNDSV